MQLKARNGQLSAWVTLPNNSEDKIRFSNVFLNVTRRAPTKYNLQNKKDWSDELISLCLFYFVLFYNFENEKKASVLAVR